MANPRPIFRGNGTITTKKPIKPKNTKPTGSIKGLNLDWWKG